MKIAEMNSVLDFRETIITSFRAICAELFSSKDFKESSLV